MPRPRRSAHRQAQQQSGAGQSERAQRTRDPEPGRRHRPSPSPGRFPPRLAAPTVESREAALARSPRVAIDTPAIRGSINLRGGRIDDVSLKTYHETVDPKSPNIVLFSPSGTQNPYYAEFGWVGAEPGALPGANTVWTADKSTLTSSSPVTLTWDNGQGLVFRRVVSVDDKFMFTVKDAVENRGSAPVTLHPYGLVSRHGTPTTLGYYVLHEGLIGVRRRPGLAGIHLFDSLDKESPVPGQNTLGKVWDNAVGGFLGHHRQVLGGRCRSRSGASLSGLVHGAAGPDRQGLSGQRSGRRLRRCSPAPRRK